MSKELCKLKKKMLKDELDSYVLLVQNPQYICTKCGRVANKKKSLCSGQKM